jgi:hypothetical protein
MGNVSRHDALCGDLFWALEMNRTDLSGYPWVGLPEKQLDKSSTGL